MEKCSLERGRAFFCLNTGARHIGEKFPLRLLANRVWRPLATAEPVHGGGGPGAPKMAVSHKSYPPAAAIFRSAKAIAPFGSSRRRTQFFFQGRQMRGCRLRRDVQRKSLRDRRFF